MPRTRALLRDEVALVWAAALVICVATVVTYTRLPAGATYHFHGSGIGGGLGRALVYLNFPVALAAIAVAASIRDRLPSRTLRAGSAAAAALCAVAALPGVVSADDLDPRWANAIPAIGVAAVLALSAIALRRPRPRVPALRGDPVRIALGALLVVWTIPWLAAAVGVYASDAPLAGGLWRAHQPTPGHPGLASVHLGLHEGLFGAQLALTALLLSRTLPAAHGRLRPALSLFLSLMLAYGIAVAAQDGWNEQVVKRGWTGVGLPDVLTPAPDLAWAGLLIAALAVHLLWFRDERPAVRTARLPTALGSGATSA